MQAPIEYPTCGKYAPPDLRPIKGTLLPIKTVRQNWAVDSLRSPRRARAVGVYP